MVCVLNSLILGKQTSLMKRRLSPINDYLGKGSVIQKLLSKSHEQQVLLGQVRSLLPAPLNEHCVAAVLKGRRLLIYTDASIWASRLRFSSRDLVTKLAESGINLEKITVRVSLGKASPKHAKSHPARQLSTANADMISQTADAISDPALQAALKRLGKHHR